MQPKHTLIFTLITCTLFACGGGGGSKGPAKPQLNNAPIASITVANNDHFVGDNIELNAGNSSDPDRDAISYEWRITRPSGETITLESNSQQIINFNADEAGDYTIVLTVTDAKGATNSESQTITINPKNTVEPNPAPQAVIEIAPQSLHVGQAVTLSGSKSSDENGDELTYLWELEDPFGQFIEFVVNSYETLEFTPAESGNYKVTLTVTDIHGAEDKTSTNFYVADITSETIVAKITGSSNVKQSETVSLSGESSELLYQTTFKWQITSKPTASQAQLTTTSGVTSQFIADQAGEYQIDLALEDINGNTDTTSFNVTASAVDNNSVPVAKISAEKTFISLGQKFHLSGEQSSDADNDPMTYTWQVTQAPSSANYTLSTPEAETTELSSDTSGNYKVSLTVDDGKATHTDTLSLQIGMRNTAPITGINLYNTTPKQGETVTFYGIALDNETTNLTYQWQLLAQPAGSTTTMSNTTSINSQLYLDKSGEYLVSFTASDGELTSEASTKAVKASVNHPPAITKVNYSTNIKVGEATTLSVEATDPEGQPLTYKWTIVEQDTGTTATFSNITEATTEFTAQNAGWYTLSVSANDGIQDSTLPTQFVLIASD